MHLKDSLNNYLILLLILAISACKKNDIGAVNNLNGGVIEVVGHGGSGFNSMINPVPTNSWESVKRAIDGYGADGVEVDVQLSKDDVLILYHDIALESLTNCDGCIRSTNSGDLINCEYDYDFSFGKQHLIKLDKVLGRFADYNPKPKIYLDLRSDNACDPTIAPFLSELSDALEQIITRYNAGDFVYIISDDRTLLGLVAFKLPGIRIFYSTNNIQEGVPIALAESYFGISLDANNASKDDVSLAHNFGLRVALFGMKSKNKILENLKKHPDLVQTDDIPLTISLLY